MIEQKKRLKFLLSRAALVMAVGLGYALFVRLTGWGIPCVFHLLTKLECPGCGVTRMCLALLRLDFYTAARYNLLLLCLLPVAAVLYGWKAVRYVRTGVNEIGKGEKIFYCIVFALCIVFSVLRNSGAVPFLEMPS